MNRRRISMVGLTNHLNPIYFSLVSILTAVRCYYSHWGSLFHSLHDNHKPLCHNSDREKTQRQAAAKKKLNTNCIQNNNIKIGFMLECGNVFSQLSDKSAIYFSFHYSYYYFFFFASMAWLFAWMRNDAVQLFSVEHTAVPVCDIAKETENLYIYIDIFILRRVKKKKSGM